MTMRRAAGLATAGLVALGTSVPASELSSSARRGREIYLRGTAGAPVTALLDDEGGEVPATVLTCLGCHGYEGEGRPEGGVIPSDIRWTALTKPYGVLATTGRRHPAYTRDSLARAIMDGIDPGGTPLLAAMPRYRMAKQDLEDLLAFLEGLGTYSDPGFDEHVVRVGMLMPADGPAAEMAEEMRATTAAVFEEVNTAGGVFGRRIELRPIVSADEGTLRQELDRQDVFALVGGWLPLGLEETLSFLESEHVPLIGPWVLSPDARPMSARFTFFLMPGRREQAVALACFASTLDGRARRTVRVLHPDTADGSALADTVVAVGQASGWTHVERTVYPPIHVRRAGRAEERRADDVFWLGDGEGLLAWLERRPQGTPRVFALGAAVGRHALALPDSFKGQLFLAFPMPPLDLTLSRARPLARLASTQKVRLRHPAAAICAYAGSRVLLEGLRRSGRLLSREKLVATLEGLSNFDAGLIPPVSYGPHERVGLVGATIVKADAGSQTLMPVREWMPATTAEAIGNVGR